MKQFDNELKKNSANYTPLNPVTFLKKTAFFILQKFRTQHADRNFSVWYEVLN